MAGADVRSGAVLDLQPYAELNERLAVFQELSC
jgi:hypothetical protein